MDQKSNDEQQQPSKFYQNQWLTIGIALGLTFGLVFDHIAIGLVMGIAVGLAIGSMLELQANKEGK